MAKPKVINLVFRVANQQLEMKLLTAREEWGKGNYIRLFKTPLTYKHPSPTIKVGGVQWNADLRPPR